MKRRLSLRILSVLLCLTLTPIITAKVEGAEPVITPGVRIQANGHDLKANGIAVSTFVVDWNNDGKKDLLVGTYSLPAVYLFLNIGTDSSPVFGEGTKLEAVGDPPAIIGADPFVVDWNNDGKKDLLLGTAYYVLLYVNVGTDSSPQFNLASTVLNWSGVDAYCAKPFVVDWNNDGKKDLLVGHGGWRDHAYIDLYINTGTDASPSFGVPTRLQAAGQDICRSYSSSPFVTDWDEDGKKDLVVRESTNFTLYRNVGTDGSPIFGEGTTIQVDGQDLHVYCGDGSSMFSVVDWNNDGVKDLVVGDYYGYVYLYLGQSKALNQPVGYWKFDEGSGLVASDSSGSGNTGTLTNGPLWVGGISGKALSFDGVDDYVEVSDITDFTFNQPLTVSAWLFLDDASKGGIIGQWGYGGLAGDAFMLSLDGAHLRGTLPIPGLYHLYSNSMIKTSEWTYAAMVYDGSTLRLYINGKLDASGSISVNPVASSQTLKIGLEDIMYGQKHYLDGLIDEVKIYHYARTAEEIWNDYTSFSATISAQYSTFVSAQNNYKKIFGQDVAIGQTVERTLSGVINDPPAHYKWNSWSGQKYPDPPDGFSIRIETIQPDYVYKIIGLGYMRGSQPSASGWIKVNSPFRIELINHVINYTWPDGSNVRLFANKDTGDITFSAKWYNYPALIDASAFEFAITIAKPGGILPPFSYDTTRSLASYAYDTDTNRVVMFGGRIWKGTSLRSDVWAFDPASSRWTSITTGSGPSNRTGASISYNPVTQKFLVYGGGTYSGETSDTWTFQFTGSNTGTWTQIPGTAPPPRFGAPMIFDSKNNLFVLFGGEKYVYSLGDTWTFNPSTRAWSNKNPSPAPPQRARAAMAYDEKSGKALLFGGLNKGLGSLLSDTWLYDAATNTWQQVSTTTAPSARQWPSLACDGNGVFYLFGGWRVDAGGGLGQYLDDTWKFDMATMQWTQLSPSTSPLAQSQGVLIPIGGDKFALINGWRDSALGEIWLYDTSQNSWSAQLELTGSIAGKISGLSGVKTSEEVIVQAFEVGSLAHHIMKGWTKMLSDSTYRIEGLPPGKYEIIASGYFEMLGLYNQYVPRTLQNIVLSPGERKNDVNLAFEASIGSLNARIPRWAMYTHTFDTSDGLFRVHYNSTGDAGNVVSAQYAQIIGNSLMLAHSFETGSSMLYPPPILKTGVTFDYSDLGRIAVYVTAIPSGDDGVTLCNPGFQNGVEFIAVRGGLDEYAVVATAYHEYYHAITISNYFTILDHLGPSDWLTEGTARWMEFQAASMDLNIMLYKEQILKHLADWIPMLDKTFPDPNMNTHPPESALSARKYDSFIYWLFMSRKFGSQIIKDIISSAHSQDAIDALLKNRYGSSNSFTKTIDECFTKYLTGMQKISGTSSFWGTDAVLVFDEWNTRYPQFGGTLFAHEFLAASDSPIADFRQLIVVGQYGAEYNQITLQSGISNLILSFSVGPEVPQEINTAFNVTILGIRGSDAELVESHEATTKNAVNVIIKDASQRYDKIWIIAVLHNGIGYYRLKVPQAALKISMHSPANLYVTDPLGLAVGIDPNTGEIVNQIPDAYLSGPSAEQQIIIIPDPINGSYNIQVHGTGKGSYTLTTELVTYIGTAAKTYSGQISLDEIQTFVANISGTELTLNSPSPTQLWIYIVLTGAFVAAAMVVFFAVRRSKKKPSNSLHPAEKTT